MARSNRQYRRPVLRPMRVLAHIHTFNDADIIDGIIEALLRQTRPVDGILVVENGSSDGSIAQVSLKHATGLRLAENTATCGAMHSGTRSSHSTLYAGT